MNVLGAMYPPTQPLVGISLLNKYRHRITNALPSSDSTARTAYAGENHAILKLKNGLTGVANYMGPGTHIEKRIARGDPPRTMMDKVAQAHDLRYFQAKTPDDIRKADQQMVKAAGMIKQKGSDSKWNILQGEKLIQLKMALTNKGSFGDLKNADKRVMSAPMISKLKELSQEGFGRVDPTAPKKERKRVDPIVLLRQKMASFI